MISEINRVLDILRFWHKIEFFIPFDLDDRMRERDGRKSFWRRRGDPAAIAFPDAPQGKIVSGYTLYIGVFDKSDVQDIVRCTASRDDLDPFEEQQRADLDGRTCIASLRLSSDACPLFETIEVSTLPWAVGCVRRAGLEALTSQAFAEARRELADEIRNFVMQRKPEEPGADRGEQLRPAEIEVLAKLFSDWAGFCPDKSHPEAALEVFFKDAPKHIAVEPPPGTTDEDEDDEDETDYDFDIGILNSFYIDDLEMVMADVSAGRLPEALRCYLTPVAEDKREDLFTAAGRQRIVETLMPVRMNRGRWLSNPDQSMSLMQQFAINTAKQRLAASGLASVNGPPGTGKTTLLRDIIADNVVSRARVLAGLGGARDAFLPDKISIPGVTTLSVLIPELTGFEMVVASSNNTAVENISRDLPKRASIGGDQEFGYLQRVAHKVAAQRGDGRCRALQKDEMPWGLIACALGRKANRWAFAERCFITKLDPARKTWAGDERPLSFWEWCSTAKVSSFAEAACAFRSADAKVEALIAELTRFCDLHRQIAGHTEESFCTAARGSVELARQQADAAGAALRLGQDELETVSADLAALREQERLLDRKTPARWQRVFRTAAARDHRARVRANVDAQIDKADYIAGLKQKLAAELEPAATRAELALQAAETLLLAVANEWSRLARSYLAYVERFGVISPPADLNQLEEVNFQKTGLWHLPQLAQLRSDLFRMALRLHEAWLAEVATNRRGFGGNLFACSKMLTNAINVDAKTLRVIWQSLFMLVPVISTTFASCARQFRGLGAESLGWLFIDEAGQAVPQAAIGVLHRAKRALVIGDPLQIEPVFTLPKRLIADLAALSPHTRDGSYSPDVVSAQFRADEGNPLGIKIESANENGIWIGTPLRVHRRCIDPMFSVANAIAYQNKMIFGLAEQSPVDDIMPFYGDSVWIDMSGQVVGRQVVPEQIEFVTRLLVATFARFGRLPDLYVISPFKEVKEHLLRAMSQRKIWTSRPSDRTLGRWLNARIGTVHTFQGKEEDTVILVLGADARTQGPVRWAASKPNILNVALTRAKRRFYMVGDRSLWAGQRFFAEAAQALPTVTQADFMHRVGARWQDRPDGENR